MMLPLWDSTASFAARKPASLQASLASAVSCGSGSPSMSFTAARISSSWALSNRSSISANFRCRPWNSQSAQPNCLRVSACSRARLKAWRLTATARAELPSRSTLKPEICFLNPPGPSSTFLPGHADVVEMELRPFLAVHEGRGLADLEPGRALLDQHRADAGRAGPVADVDEKEPGLNAAGAEDRGAVDDLAVAFGLGDGL
jgi:hypothetical protein